MSKIKEINVETVCSNRVSQSIVPTWQVYIPPVYLLGRW